MLFNSYEFILVFLPLTWVLFFSAAPLSHRWALGLLTLASLVFYAWWNPRWLVLLLASAMLNFLFGRALARRGGGRLLATAVALNLALLAGFKYSNWLIESANTVLGTHWPGIELLLPLGISFFTFTQIAYLVDISRQQAREADPLRYLLFVTYFPHLIAGPVIHHQQMMPQFAKATTFRPQLSSICSGLTLFVIGLFKKVVLADQLAPLVGPVFDGGATPSAAMAWAATLAYALQLYFDFSGYCDMAMGISRLFNIELPLNFDSPYQARSLIDFWRRWHITLSAFLRDYLYIALGGNRRGTTRRHVNLMLTMLLGGLWHGAGWTFVCWGALHGMGLVANHGWRHAVSRWRWPDPLRHAAIARALTFLFVVLAWVPFRAPDMASATRIWGAMAGWAVGPAARPSPGWLLALALCTAAVIGLPNAIAWVDRSAQRGLRLAWRPTPVWGAAIGGLLAVALLSFNRNSPFLYYQF